MTSHAEVCSELVKRTAAVPGLRLFRNNVSAQKFGDRFVKSGLGPGTSDYVGTYYGLSLWIEVKFGRDAKATDKRSQRQRKFLDAMRDLHCIVLVVTPENVEAVVTEIEAAAIIYWRKLAPAYLKQAGAQPDQLTALQSSILQLIEKRGGTLSYSRLVNQRRAHRQPAYALAVNILLDHKYIEWKTVKGGRTITLTDIGRRALQCMD